MPRKASANKKVAQSKTVKSKTVKSKAAVPSQKPIVTATPVVSSADSAKHLNKIEPKKLFWPLLALVIVLAFYLLKDELIVASVNGKPITRMAVIRELERQGASQVVEDMVLRAVVEQELKKSGIKIDDAAVDVEFAQIEEQLSAQGQNIDDLLSAQNLTRSEVKQQIALSKGMEQLLADGLEVSDEEIAKYFTENKELLGEGADLETMRNDIREMLFQQKLGTKQQSWLEEVKKNAKINYFKFEPSINL
jgi:hypothetical protein